MKQNPLLFGIIGFLIGGLVVALAVTTFDKPKAHDSSSMNTMVSDLQGKKGDAFDQAFLGSMLEHHKAAVEMAQLAEKNAKHDEVKSLANSIDSAQSKEILDIINLQAQYGYPAQSNKNMSDM